MTSQPPGDRPDHPAADTPTEPVPAVDPTVAGPDDPTAVQAAVGAEPAPVGTPDSAAPVWRSQLGRAWRYARWPVYAGAAAFALLILIAAWIWTTTDLPPLEALSDSAVLVDRNGEELAVLAQDGLRLELSLEEMGPIVPQAVLAAEDRRFYDHDGVDPVGIARAVWNNVTDDDIQGGSTITQQLVKNVYLDSDRTVTRKVREAVLAMKLERDADKDEILERYLNTVYFGRGSYGIEAAARTYFDTSAAELRPEQAALLAGILRSPESLDPVEAHDAAKERRDVVLAGMAEMGALPEVQARAAMRAPIEVVAEPSPTTLTAGVAPHFVEQVRRLVIEQFGERALYDRGLVVHTTLDIADQRAAEAAVAAHLDDPADPQAAVVGIDRSGAVRAWVGGRNFDELKVDLVAGDGGSGRQPGSTFKPMVLAANLEAGYGAGQRFPAPAEITLDAGGEPWEVSNAGGDGYGTLTLADATVQSVNTVYAQAVLQVGPKAVADLARRLGIGRELDAQPSIALGTEEVTPLELATAFSTLSRSGQRIDPYTVTKIESRDGGVLFEQEEPEPEQVLRPEVADTVNAILSETPRRGTARRAALDRPMAAKTGTTQENADAWLAGYTPEYTAIVWMGYPDGNQPMDTVDDVRVQGGTIPAMIWHDFMAEALTDVEPTEFSDPDRQLLGQGTRDSGRDVEPERDERREQAEQTTTSSSSSTSSSTSSTSTTEPDTDDDGTTTTASSTTTAPTTTTTQATTTTAAASSDSS